MLVFLMADDKWVCIVMHNVRMQMCISSKTSRFLLRCTKMVGSRLGREYATDDRNRWNLHGGTTFLG